MTRRQSKDPSEFYRTPPWVVWRLLEAVPPTLVAGGRWLDPCVGDGALPKAVASSAFGKHADFHTVDIRPTGYARAVGDYLQMDPPSRKHNVCIMNPPFSLALEFAQKAVAECWHVFMLQRLNWLASQERNAWLRENTPGIYVLPNRPDFTGGGGDSHDYAWFAWGWTQPAVSILDTTPLHVRKAQKPSKEAA